MAVLPKRVVVPAPEDSDVKGMVVMAFASLLWNAMLLVARLSRMAGWPELPLYALSNTASLLFVAASAVLLRPKWPGKRAMFWCTVRALCTTVSLVTTMLAVHCGLDFGDFAALMSVSVAAASVQGWLFCGEQLTGLHFMAVLSSMAGALLIAQPGFLFGGGAVAPWYAYVLALCSGLADAGIYVCSRTTAGTDPRISLSMAMALTPVALTLYGFVLGEGMGAAVFAARPLEGLAWVMGVTTFSLCAMLLFTIGSQWCPASASATVDTATRMASGYGLEVGLFHARLNGLQSSGAVLMLCAVSFMALTTETGREALTRELTNDVDWAELQRAISATLSPDSKMRRRALKAHGEPLLRAQRDFGPIPVDVILP